MKNKTLIILLCAEAVVLAIIALAFAPSEGSSYLVLASFPFAQIGQLLRALSLSGPFGNIVAFVLYIGICLIPLLFTALHIKKRTVKAEDSLLLVISVYAFFMLYAMINPGTLSGIPSFINADAGKAMLGGVCDSLLIGYFVIKLLRKSGSTATESLLKIMRLLFAITAAIIVINSCYIGISNLQAKIIGIQTGNTDPLSPPTFIIAFVVLRYVVMQAPAVMMIGIFLLAIQLCEHLRIDRYGEDAINAAKKLAMFSKVTVIVSLLCTLTLNLTQLALAGSLLNLDFLTTLPVDTLIVAFAALLLTRFFTASRALKQDNQLFI